MTDPYRYTSGRMLHYQDCLHFVDDLPARLATDDELRTLPVCGTCAGAAPVKDGPPSFTCPNCHMTYGMAMRAASGICRDCEAG